MAAVQRRQHAVVNTLAPLAAAGSVHAPRQTGKGLVAPDRSVMAAVLAALDHSDAAWLSAHAPGELRALPAKLQRLVGVAPARARGTPAHVGAAAAPPRALGAQQFAGTSARRVGLVSGPTFRSPSALRARARARADGGPPYCRTGCTVCRRLNELMGRSLTARRRAHRRARAPRHTPGARDGGGGGGRTSKYTNDAYGRPTNDAYRRVSRRGVRGAEA